VADPSSRAAGDPYTVIEARIGDNTALRRSAGEARSKPASAKSISNGLIVLQNHVRQPRSQVVPRYDLLHHQWTSNKRWAMPPISLPPGNFRITGARSCARCSVR